MNDWYFFLREVILEVFCCKFFKHLIWIWHCPGSDYNFGGLKSSDSVGEVSNRFESWSSTVSKQMFAIPVRKSQIKQALLTATEAVHQPQHGCRGGQSVRTQCGGTSLDYWPNPSRASRPLPGGQGDERRAATSSGKPGPQPPRSCGFSVGYVGWQTSCSQTITLPSWLARCRGQGWHVWPTSCCFLPVSFLFWPESQSCHRLSDSIHLEDTMAVFMIWVIQWTENRLSAVGGSPLVC